MSRTPYEQSLERAIAGSRRDVEILKRRPGVASLEGVAIDWCQGNWFRSGITPPDLEDGIDIGNPAHTPYNLASGSGGGPYCGFDADGKPAILAVGLYLMVAYMRLDGPFPSDELPDYFHVGISAPFHPASGGQRIVEGEAACTPLPDVLGQAGGPFFDVPPTWALIAYWTTALLPASVDVHIVGRADANVAIQGSTDLVRLPFTGIYINGAVVGTSDFQLT